MRRGLTGAAVVGTAALLLAACGGVGGPPGSGGSAATGAAEVLVGSGLIMQADGAAAQLCLGAVADSYPPQCGGPELIGFESWDGLDHESASGWSWGSAWVIGTYTGETFTLTEAPSADPPAGWSAPTTEPLEFPQLCDDPAADPGDPAGVDLIVQQSDLSMFLESYDGYVLSYVSGGGDVMNVLVAGDADQARAQFREIYGGPLCVQTSTLPAWTEIRAAQDALSAQWEELGLLSSGSGVSGLLEVSLVVADAAHVAAVTDAVGQWLEPDEVVITGALQPFDG